MMSDGEIKKKNSDEKDSATTNNLLLQGKYQFDLVRDGIAEIFIKRSAHRTQSDSKPTVVKNIFIHIIIFPFVLARLLQP